MNIAENGSFLCETPDEHAFDHGLCSAISRLFMEHGILNAYDFGCGSGAYVEHLCKYGFDVVGFDGNPNTPKFNSQCQHRDLAKIFQETPRDAVVSLEVGEHIPQQYEYAFIDNIDRHAINLVVISWFPYRGEGIAHVNERDNDYVIQQFESRGFVAMRHKFDELRNSASLWWFKKSLMAFKRVI